MTYKHKWKLFFPTSTEQAEEITNGYTSNWFLEYYCQVTNKNIIAIIKIK